MADPGEVHIVCGCDERAIARDKLAHAEALLNEAARALTRWGAQAQRVMRDPMVFTNVVQLPESLEDRCKLANEVGRIAANVGAMASGLEHSE